MGTWKIEKDSTIHIESWQKVNDTLFTGEGCMMKDSDTLFFEKLKLICKSDSVFYIPAVSDQNSGQDVLFKLTSLKQNEFIFENREHDFPQRITYQFRSDTMCVWVEGNDNGTSTKIDFVFKKMTSIQH